MVQSATTPSLIVRVRSFKADSRGRAARRHAPPRSFMTAIRVFLHPHLTSIHPWIGRYLHTGFA